MHKTPSIVIMLLAGLLVCSASAEKPAAAPPAVPAAAAEPAGEPAAGPETAPADTGTTIQPPAETPAPDKTPAPGGAPLQLTEEEKTDAQDIYADIALLTEAMLLIRRHYVEPLEYRGIVYRALHGMLSNLDPHSDFLEPRQADDLKEEAEGEFGGIGIQIGVRAGFPVVIAPIEDSPAYAAGLMAGDAITAIGGKQIHGINLDSVMRQLRGEPGTSVTITVERDGQEPFDVTLVRERIKVASVKGARILPESGGRIGYLRITQFSEPTGEEVASALAVLRTNDLAGLVVDLRGNPGGLLGQAIAVAEQFLPAGTVVVTTRGRKDAARAPEIFRARRRDGLVKVPLAVLIDGGTASAAEIVTGALQDAGRAIVIGEKSYGKASVQQIMPLSAREETALKLTVAHYYTPVGRMIHGKGIEPDIVVPVTAAAWSQVRRQREYEERPDVYPATERTAALEQVVADEPLRRAMDILLGVDILSRRRK